MKYVNTRTGAVIDTAFVISGGDWKELVDDKKEEKKSAKKISKKKSGDD